MALMKVLRFAVCGFGLFISCVLCPAYGRDKVVNVYGWSDFVDPKVIEDFTKETGIKVAYDTFSSVEELETRLAAGQTGFDVAIVPGRVLQRQIAAGLYLRLDKTRLPNSKHCGRRSRHFSRPMIRATNTPSIICGLPRALPTTSTRLRKFGAARPPLQRSRLQPRLPQLPCSIPGAFCSNRKI